MFSTEVHQNRLYLVTVLFAVAFIAGITTEHPPDLILESINSLRNSAQTLDPVGPLGFFVFIFLNNLIALFFMLVSGVTFGIFPIISTLVNAFLIGFVAHLSSLEVGLTTFFVGIVPHGVVEVPALLIAVVLSFDITDATISSLKSRSIKPLKGAFKKTLEVFRKYILLLLLIAAGIEAFVTPHIIELALR